MIKLEIAANGTQTITKVCNMCGCHIDDLAVEDIISEAIVVNENQAPVQVNLNQLRYTDAIKRRIRDFDFLVYS